MGNHIVQGNYPFGAQLFSFGGTFPLDPAVAAPPTITPPSASNGGVLFGFDPQLRLPYTLEWNVSMEQSLGKHQAISASYIGASGRRLLQTASIRAPSPNLGGAVLVTNAGTSDYNALQFQFQRRLAHGLQAVASYTWSHSMDTASAGSLGLTSNALLPTSTNSNRGPSDFDVRNAFSAAITYNIPTLRANAFTKAVLRGWSLQNVIQARSAPPVDISDINFFTFNGGIRADIRPDLIPA